MDQRLLPRWQKGEQPFDGSALWVNTDLPRSTLAEVVSCVLALLAEKVGVAEHLLVNEDWHNHDGYVTSAAEVSTAVFLREVSAPDSTWYQLKDTFVYWGVYDQSLGFYLRFGMGDEDEAGYCEVSTTQEIALLLAAELKRRFDIPTEIESAKELFDRTCAG